MPPKKNRYWQITIIAEDDLTLEQTLSNTMIEHGIRKNLLPLFLTVHDVEAMEIGDKPIKLRPEPKDFHGH